jgi:Zn-dependent M28 family amino/carboxypeptidase
VRICLFMNEENGLRGGRAYAEAHAAELEKHVLALETDRGGFAPAGFETDVKGAGFEAMRAHVALFKGTGADRLIEGGGGADISPLARAGVPLSEFVPDPQRYFDVHHCARDVVSMVNPRELELGAAVIAGMAWCVADAAEALPHNTVQPK